MSKLSLYLHQRGHAPRSRLRVGKRDTLEVEVHESYIHLTLHSPSRTTQEIYIPRTVWYRLLKWVVPLSKLMDLPDHYVPDATRAYLKREAQFAQELRRQKKQRR